MGARMSSSMVRMTVPMKRVMNPQNTKKWATPVARSRLATVWLEAMAASEVCSGRDATTARAVRTWRWLRVWDHSSRSRPVGRPRRYLRTRFQA
jgi:hypothetical protein